jgi:hypothetical protein
MSFLERRLLEDCLVDCRLLPPESIRLGFRPPEGSIILSRRRFGIYLTRNGSGKMGRGRIGAWSLKELILGLDLGKGWGLYLAGDFE